MRYGTCIQRSALYQSTHPLLTRTPAVPRGGRVIRGLTLFSRRQSFDPVSSGGNPTRLFLWSFPPSLPAAQALSSPCFRPCSRRRYSTLASVSCLRGQKRLFRASLSSLSEMLVMSRLRYPSSLPLSTHALSCSPQGLNCCIPLASLQSTTDPLKKPAACVSAPAYHGQQLRPSSRGGGGSECHASLLSNVHELSYFGQRYPCRADETLRKTPGDWCSGDEDHLSARTGESREGREARTQAARVL